MALILKMLWDYRKAVMWAIFAVAAAVLWWRVSAWHDAYERLQATEDALELERACAPGSACAERQAALEAAQRETTAKVVGSYEAELAGLRNRPARVVRVCPDAGSVQGSGAPGAADGSGAPAGQLPGQARQNPDIGPDLYDLARQADEVAARLRALQEWNRALSAD